MSIAGPVLSAPATPSTIAALPPAATKGRGAKVPFIEYEAENGVTNGTLIGPDRTFTHLASEASGRRAVLLRGVGGYVDIVLAHPANAVTLRYALPDSPDGRGLDGAISVWADGQRLGILSLTSRYGWFYGRYPFTNDPGDGKPHHFYDEARLLLPRTLRSGATVRFLVETPDAAAWRVLDVADFELVPPALTAPANALSVLKFGADPSGRASSADAFDAAVAAGRLSGRPVWIDPGVYRIDRHLVVDQVTLAGAGPWYSVLRGEGVGIYGKPGGGRLITLRDFAIMGEVTARDDHAHLAGIGGAMSDTTITNLWIQHEKNGLWFDGPMARIMVSGLRILDETADGLNFDRGVTDATVQSCFVRDTGDDGLASWSHVAENARIRFQRNTVIAPILANGIALYGGRDLTVSDNLVADSLTEGGGLHMGSRFSATPFAGKIVLAHNTTVRAGGMDPNWRSQVGALWFYALERPIDGAEIQVRDVDLIDSTYGAIQFTGARPVSGVTFERVRIEGSGTFAVQLQTAGRAVFNRVTARGLGAGGVADCGSGFTVIRGAGDHGWDDRACPAR